MERGQHVLIKHEYWKIDTENHTPSVPTDMKTTQGTVGIITDKNANEEIYEVDNTWWYAKEWIEPVDTKNPDKLFELYVNGHISSREYNTLSKVKGR